jgi:hypothetical protein
MLLLSPYLPACNIVGQGETGTILPFSETGRNLAFSLHRDLPGSGVYDCNTNGAWGLTPCFLPIKHLRLRAQQKNLKR